MLGQRPRSLRFGKPLTKRSSNRASGVMLKAEFAALSKLLNEELDPLMLRFKTTQPEFYAEFVAARDIVGNPGGRPAKNGANGNDTPSPTPPQ